MPTNLKADVGTDKVMNDIVKMGRREAYDEKMLEM